MTGRYRVNWLRRDRAYIVIDNGKEIGRFDELTEAWSVAESLERDHPHVSRRVGARLQRLAQLRRRDADGGGEVAARHRLKLFRHERVFAAARSRHGARDWRNGHGHRQDHLAGNPCR